MDNSSQTKKPLPGLRTFAKDLEKKRGPKVAPSVTSTPTKPAVAPAPVKSEAPAVYEAPQWKKTSAKTKAEPKPLPPPDPVKSADLPEISHAPASLTTTESDIIIGNSEDAGGATIIRDTKRNRFQLFPALTASITDWIERFKERQKERRKPKYTVQDSTHRKGVIQRATSKTGKVASFDAPSIQERIRERDAKTKPQPKEPETFWTPNTEPGYELLEAPDRDELLLPDHTSIDPTPTNVVITPKRSVHTPVEDRPLPPTVKPVAKTPPVTKATPAVVKPMAPKFTLPTIPTPPRKPITKLVAPVTREIPPHRPLTTSRIATTFSVKPPRPTPRPPAQPTPPPPLPVKTPPIQDRIEPPKVPAPVKPLPPKVTVPETPPPLPPTPPAQPLPPSVIPAEPIPVTSEPTYNEPEDLTPADSLPEAVETELQLIPPERKPRGPREWLLAENTNRLSMALVVMVVVISSLGSGIYLLVKSQLGDLRTNPTYPFNNLLETPLQTIPLTNLSRDSIIAAVTRNVAESGYPIQQLVLVSDRSSSNRTATPIPPGDILNALGLTANPNLSLGLSELYFGSINQRPFLVMRSNNANAARGGMLAWENSLYSDLKDILGLTTTTEGRYRDVVLENIDTRIYRNHGDGTEIFLYGIVNRNLIIVTQNRVDFTTLAKQISQP